MKFSRFATELVVLFKLVPKLIANFNKLQELLTIKHFFCFPEQAIRPMDYIPNTKLFILTFVIIEIRTTPLRVRRIILSSESYQFLEIIIDFC